MSEVPASLLGIVSAENACQPAAYVTIGKLASLLAVASCREMWMTE